MPRLQSPDSLKDVQLQIPLRIYSRDNSLLAEFGDKRRIPVKLNEVPPLLIKAVLAAEDSRFYEHTGVDMQGLLRAAFQLAKTGEKSQGGSTITMQVARNFFLSSEKTFLRKLNEILLAFKIEKTLSKDEILELYLNKIYLGHQAYGVASAAEVYYGKALKDLNLAELAMIAGLPKAPSTLNPVNNPERAVERRNYVLGRMLQVGEIDEAAYDDAVKSSNTARLHARTIGLYAPYIAEMARNYIISKYGDKGYDAGYQVYTTIRDNLQNAASEALQTNLINYDRRHGYRGPTLHVNLPEDATENQWRSLLSAYGPVGGLIPALVVTTEAQSITVYTYTSGTVELSWNALTWGRRYLKGGRWIHATNAREIFKPGDIIYLSGNKESKDSKEPHYQLAQVPDVEGAMVALDPNDGAILALIGGYDYAHSKFNRVTQGKRQVGSSFKPFIYSAALEAGYTPASVINDAPISIALPGSNEVWRPENYNHKYYGPTRLRDALAFSRNMVSVRLLQAVGMNRTIKHLKRFGFPPDALEPNLSMALGSGAMTPVELAAGYTVFANGGYLVEPYFIDRIETHTGETVMQSNPLRVCQNCKDTDLPEDSDDEDDLDEDDIEHHSNPQDSVTLPPGNYARRVISSKNAWIMQSMLRDVVTRGTAVDAKVLGRRDLSGKTGTTNDHKDVWFTGFNTRIVATTWMGYDMVRSLGRNQTGGKLALPVWIRFMRTALQGMPHSVLPQPPDVKATVDKSTGLLSDNSSPMATTKVAFRSELPVGSAIIPQRRRSRPSNTTATRHGGPLVVVPGAGKSVSSSGGGAKGVPEQLF